MFKVNIKPIKSHSFKIARNRENKSWTKQWRVIENPWKRWIPKIHQWFGTCSIASSFEIRVAPLSDSVIGMRACYTRNTGRGRGVNETGHARSNGETELWRKVHSISRFRESVCRLARVSGADEWIHVANRILAIVPSLLVNDSVYTLTQTIRSIRGSTTSSTGGELRNLPFFLPVVAFYSRSLHPASRVGTIRGG